MSKAKHLTEEVITRALIIAVVAVTFWYIGVQALKSDIFSKNSWAINESHYGQVTVVNPERDVTLFEYDGAYTYSHSRHGTYFYIFENGNEHTFNAAAGDSIVIEEVR